MPRFFSLRITVQGKQGGCLKLATPEEQLAGKKELGPIYLVYDSPGNSILYLLKVCDLVHGAYYIQNKSQNRLTYLPPTRVVLQDTRKESCCRRRA